MRMRRADCVGFVKPLCDHALMYSNHQTSNTLCSGSNTSNTSRHSKLHGNCMRQSWPIASQAPVSYYHLPPVPASSATAPAHTLTYNQYFLFNLVHTFVLYSFCRVVCVSLHCLECHGTLHRSTQRKRWQLFHTAVASKGKKITNCLTA